MIGRKGMFIVIEGIDGSGKTTQANLLAEYFKKTQDRPVILTSEPWEHTKTGRLLRKYMAKDNTEYVNDEIFSKLFAVNRLQHMDDPNHGICKLLDDDCIVISDRSVISSMVYQPNFVKTDNRQILNNSTYCPDLIILLELDEQKVKERIDKRNESGEYYENVNTIDAQMKAYRAATISLMKRYVMKCRDIRLNYKIKDFEDMTKFVFNHIMMVNGDGDVQDVHNTIVSKLFMPQYLYSSIPMND